MPDRDLPPKYQKRLKLVRLGLYCCIAGAAVASLSDGYTRIEGIFGHTLSIFWTVTTVTGSLISMVGVVANRYRVEWVASYMVGAGIASYAVLYWYLSFDVGNQFAIHALFSTALLFAVYYRSTELASHAAKLRAQFFALGE